jgi:glycosyltransferase involved in cell wall biosynthesis
MYAGMPAVLSDIPQHREVAMDKDFLLTLPFDEERWVNEINRFSGMSKDQLKALGKKSRAYVKENFSLAAMHKKYDEIYTKLMV